MIPSFRDGECGMIKAGIIALAALIASSAASLARNVIYIVTYQDPTIIFQGLLETDGTIGPLSQSDILSYQLVALSVSDSIFIQFSPSDSALSLTGNDLVASNRNLTFDYGGGDGGTWLVQRTDLLPLNFFLCNATTGQSTCEPGVSVVAPPPEISVFSSPSGVVVIGSVPEPSTWVMVLAGFVGLGFMGWRSQRKSVTAA
jgi:PEP-CTERM motif